MLQRSDRNDIFQQIVERGQAAAPMFPYGYWFAQMQMSHTLASLRRPQFDGPERVRSRRHLMLKAVPGIGKGNRARFFLDYIAGAVPYSRVHLGERQYGFRPPTYIALGGRGTSWERLLGGFVGKGNARQFVMPVFADADYLFLSELTAFLGDRDILPLVNDIVEDGYVERTLNNYAAAEDLLTEKDDERMLEHDIVFNAENATMSYQASCSVIACTHFLDEDEEIDLRRTGFMSRMATETFTPSREGVRSIIRDKFAAGDWSDILESNLKMWQMKVEDFPLPPSEAVEIVGGALADAALDSAEDAGIASHEIITLRDRGHIFQLIAGAAWARTVASWPDVKKPVPVLLYEESDYEVARWFYERAIETNLAEALGNSKPDETIVKDTTGLRRLQEHLGDRNVFTRNDVVKAGVATKGGNLERLIKRWGRERNWITKFEGPRFTITEAGLRRIARA